VAIAYSQTPVSRICVSLERRVSTDEILVLMDLSPCGVMLYLWIQTVPIEDGVREVYLKEFIDHACTDGRKGYAMEWTKQTFYELEKYELITIAKKYNSSVFKVKVWRPRLKRDDPASQPLIEA
jgi:hypothetical protein